MTFSKEDKAAWQDSEIMREFERIAMEQNVLNGPPPEAFQPVGEEEDEEELWEEEDNEDKLLSAVNELGIAEEEQSDDTTLSSELLKMHTSRLLENLKKVASNLAVNSKMRVAYRIERTIYNLQALEEDR